MFDVLEFIKSQNITYLGTVVDDQPHVRVMSGFVEIDGKLAFCTSIKKEMYEEIKKNPKIEYCLFDKGIVVRLSAVCVEDSSQEAKDAYLKLQPGVAQYYGGGEAEMAVMVLKEATALVSSKDYKDEIVLY